MKTKHLLIATAAIEAGAGVTLLASPAFAAWILLDAPFDTPAASIIGRVAGAALLSLALACWRARFDVHSPAATAIASAMLLYNSAAALVIAYAGIGLRLSGFGLWPAVVVHFVMAVWCFVCLIKK